jgi:hypothetical protein
VGRKGLVRRPPDLPRGHRRRCLRRDQIRIKNGRNPRLRTEDLLALLNSGFLREKEVDMWRAAAGDPYPMEKSPDEIPMFTRFAERGLSLPASDFFKGLLGYYGIEYLNLNPNGIFHTSVFVHFCEAFLGIKPHWILFRKFF